METPDYGIDTSIEVVTEDGRVTGKRFFAQLKATDAVPLETALRVKLKQSTFRYLQGLDVPTLVVLFHAATGHVFCRWVHDLDVFYAGRSRDHFTFHLELTDQLDPASTPAKLERDLDDWRWLHAPSLSLPIVLRLNISTSEIRGHQSSDIVERLGRLARPLFDTLQIREVPAERPRGEVDVSGDGIIVRLHGGGGASIHRSLAAARSRRRKRQRGLPAEPRGPVTRKRQNRDVVPAEAVAADILIAVSMALQQAGHNDNAAAVAAIALEHATVSRNPAAAATLFQLLLSTNRHAAVVDTAAGLTRAGEHELAQLALTSVFLTAPPTEGRERLEDAFDTWLSAIPADAPADYRGTAHYNLGRYFARPGWAVTAGIKHFAKAARIYPSYRTRSYFWQELGGMFFHVGRHQWSAHAYGEAIRLGAPNETHAREADALWRTGRYGAAKEAMERYAGHDPHWVVFGMVLPTLVDVAGTTLQVRDPEAALQHISRAERLPTGDPSIRQCWIDAIRSDALTAVAWFNLGIAAAAGEQYDDAIACFLLAAFLHPQDAESWSNALAASIMLARAEQDSDAAGRLFTLIAQAGARQDREGLFRLLVSRLRPETDQARRMVRQVFEVIGPSRDPAPVVRVTLDESTLVLAADDPEKAFRMLMDHLSTT